jgi:hypothetical protein|uniref:Uncharacterized protein n=1 Tax=viral metagenome TaxID=1070528 RepID=A0A6C0M005_9ZZZZ
MLSRKIITLLIYIILLAILFAIQPNLFFDKDGNMRCFGFDINNSNDNSETILPLILFIPFIALISYLIILIIEMIYT